MNALAAAWELDADLPNFTKLEALEAAYARRDRARQADAAATAELERRNRISAEQHATLREAWSAESAPALDLSEAPLLAQRTRDAEARALAADRQLAAAAQATDATAAELRAAQAEVENEADALLDAEADQLAARILEGAAQLRKLGEKLAVYSRTNSLNTPRDRLRIASKKVEQALASLPPVDLWHTRRDDASLSAAQVEYNERRATLIAG